MSASDIAKQKFHDAVSKTQEPGDAKGPPGGKLKVAQPSKDDASISNKFVNPGRTAHAQSDTNDAHQSTAGNNSFGTSFFKPSSAT